MKVHQSVLCIVERRVTANNTEAFNVTQQCSYGEFMSPTTIKFTYLRVKCPIFLSDFTQIRMYEDHVIKFHGNPSSWSRADTHKRTDGHDSANRHFMRLFDRFEQAVLWVLSTCESSALSCGFRCLYRGLNSLLLPI